MRQPTFFFKIFFSTSFFYFILSCSLSAQPIYCATPIPATPELAPSDLDPDCYPVIPGPYYIRIFPHVIRAAPNESGGQSDAAIKQAIEIMRADFAARNIFFVWDDCDINVIADNDLYTANAPSLQNLYTTYGNSNGINLFFFPTDQGNG